MYKFLLDNRALVYLDSKLAKFLLRANYVSIMLFGCILCKDNMITKWLLNHENIHRAQYIDCCVIGLLIGIALLLLMQNKPLAILLLPVLTLSFYYMLYAIEYAIRRFASIFSATEQWEVYRRCSMECEAYDNQEDFDYLSKRRPFAWLSNIMH